MKFVILLVVLVVFTVVVRSQRNCQQRIQQFCQAQAKEGMVDACVNCIQQAKGNRGTGAPTAERSQQGKRRKGRRAPRRGQQQWVDQCQEFLNTNATGGNPAFGENPEAESF